MTNDSSQLPSRSHGITEMVQGSSSTTEQFQVYDVHEEVDPRPKRGKKVNVQFKDY